MFFKLFWILSLHDQCTYGASAPFAFATPMGAGRLTRGVPSYTNAFVTTSVNITHTRTCPYKKSVPGIPRNICYPAFHAVSTHARTGDNQARISHAQDFQYAISRSPFISRIMLHTLDKRMKAAKKIACHFSFATPPAMPFIFGVAGLRIPPLCRTYVSLR